MSDNYSTKPSVLFWTMAIFFILWGLIGCGIYLMEMTMSDAAYLEAYGAEMAAVRHLHPSWGISAFAIAVWSGLIAAILFILRKRLSASIYIVSLVAAIIGFLPVFINSTLREAAGSTFWIMPAIVISLGIVEVIYSRKQRANGVLR